MRHLHPYLNYERPCGFVAASLGERGKRRRQYKAGDYRTPLEKLQEMDKPEQYLQSGVSLRELEREARAIFDWKMLLRLNFGMSFPVPIPHFP